MPFNHFAGDLTELHHFLVYELLNSPDCESSPRGMRIKELIAPTISLLNPRNRLIISPARNVNYGFAVGELCWYIRGDSDLATMSYYNKRMAQFSDDGKTINSAYGARIFNGIWADPGQILTDVSQFDCCVAELKNDPDSRRAVMHINQPGDLRRATHPDIGSKDVPCTMSIQLLIRDRRLHMFVVMRSNDVIWGLPYDIFSFTCLMETFLYILQEEGVPVDDLGTYHHTAGSLHLYERHWDMAKAISEEPLPPQSAMLPMTLEGIRYLATDLEPKIRSGSIRAFSDPESRLGSERWMIDQLLNHRRKRTEEELIELTKITEEAGGYPELMEEKEKDEPTS